MFIIKSSLILFCLIAGTIGEDKTFKRFVVFGDSYSDDGVDTLTDIHGFGRLSNGPVWSEYLAQQIGLKCRHTENYAYHGAKSGFDNHHGFGNWSGVLWQVDKYFCIYDSVPPKTLIALQAGGIFDLDKGARLESTVARNARKALDILANKGADFILVLSMMDPWKIPGYSRRSDGSLVAGAVTEANRLLQSEVTDFQYQNPGITLKYLDLPAIWWEIEQKFGKTTEVFPGWEQPYWNIEEKKYLGEYMWYTGFHPTTAVHRKIADKAHELINE